MGLPQKNEFNNESVKTVNFLDKFIKTYGVFPVVGSADDYILNEKIRSSGKEENIVVLNPNSSLAQLLKNDIPKIHELVNIETADNYPKNNEEENKQIFYMSQQLKKTPKLEKSNDDTTKISKEKDNIVITEVPTVIEDDSLNSNLGLPSFKTMPYIPQILNTRIVNNYGVKKSYVRQYAMQIPQATQYEIKNPIMSNNYYSSQYTCRGSLESKIGNNQRYTPKLILERRRCSNYYRIRY